MMAHAHSRFGFRVRCSQATIFLSKSIALSSHCLRSHCLHSHCLSFRFLQKYLQKETELLQLGKANVSATTQANRQKKMQEISSLVKYFIRCANKSKGLEKHRPIEPNVHVTVLFLRCVQSSTPQTPTCSTRSWRCILIHCVLCDDLIIFTKNGYKKIYFDHLIDETKR